MNNFKLIAEQMQPPKNERAIVDQTMRYLNTLRVKGAMFWVNEEHKGTYGRSHPLRRRASDILGIFQGRWIAFEMKIEKDYKYIIGHWDKFKGRQYKWATGQHFGDQIDFIEMIRSHGGIAEFACSWEMVKEICVREGLDK